MLIARLFTANARRMLLALVLAVSLTSALGAAAVLYGPAALGVATLSATKVDALLVDNDGDGLADAGDTIRYTVNLTNNTAGDLTGINFSDMVDANTTYVPGSANVSPLPFNDSYDTIGNTLLEVGTGPGSNPSVQVAGNVKANDVDFLGDVSDVIISHTNPLNGTVVMTHSNGTFTYLPNPGFSGVDTFTYVVQDSGGLTGQATVTINVLSMLWYVKNNAAPGGLGRSTDPFDTLVEAESASAINQTIYVFNGDGTTTGQNAGITLKGGQRFVGEGVALTMPVSVNGGPNPTTLRAAGTKPRVNNASGNGAQATDVIPIEIVGLSLSGSVNAIDLTLTGGFGGSGTLTIANDTVFAAGAEGIDINMGGTGTLTMDVHTNTWTTTAASLTGNGFDARRTAGTLRVNFSDNTNITSQATGVFIDGGATASTAITGFANNTVHQNTLGTGMSISNVTFDATPGGSYQQVAGGTTSVGIPGDGVGGSGIVMSTVAGDLGFTDLDIVADGGAGLQVGGTNGAGVGVNIGAGSGMRVTVNPGVGTIAAIGGPAVSITSATIDLQLADLDSTNSATTGVLLSNVVDGTTSATLTAGSGSTINNATGTDFSISGGNATVTYDGTITDDVGQLVSVASATGDTIQFRGAITDGDDGDGSGVSLTSNAGTTIRFSGGLVLSTGANPAFTATGGAAAVEVCDENPCNPGATGGLVNKLTTTTGTALNVANTTIGANNLEFKSIASNGAANGIVLNTTGSTGGLKVKGDGTNNASGGLITNMTNDGVLLTSTQNVSLTSMKILNTAHYGVAGTGVVNFSFINGTIDNSGTGLTAQDSNIGFNLPTSGSANIAGTLTVSGSTLDNSFYHGVTVRQDRGVITNLNISSNAFTSSAVSANSNGSAIDIDPTGHAGGAGGITTGTINNNSINNFPSGAGIQVLPGNTTPGASAFPVVIGSSSASKLTISGNAISGQSLANGLGTNAIAVQLGGYSSGFIDIVNNGTVAVPLKFFKGNGILMGCTGECVLRGVIQNNVMDAAANIVASPGISVGTDNTFATSDTPAFTLDILNNTVNNSDGNGILATARAATAVALYKIQNNVIGAPRSGVRPGIRIDAGNASSIDDYVCLNISGNTSAGSGGTQGIGLRKQGTTTTTNDFAVNGMVATSSPGVEAYVNGLNPAGNGTLLISATSGFSNCSLP